MMRNLMSKAALVLGALPVGGAATAATIVATPATIVAAFARASAGDTLQLVGTFGNVRLQNRNFAATVILDGSQATFADTLILQNDSHVVLSGGTFAAQGGTSYGRAVAVWGGDHIAVDDVTVAGAGGMNAARDIGVLFQGTVDATAAHDRLDGLYSGITFDSVTGGSAVGNIVTHATSDGIDIGDSHTIVASNNSCSAGNPADGAHPDCIQLWSTAGKPVESDITVVGNTASGPTQGFTEFASGGGGLRLTISNNSVATSMPQGIACYDCVDSTISYNSVTTLPGAAHLTTINIIGGTGNTVVGNIVNPRTPVPHATLPDEYAPDVAVASSSLSGPGQFTPPAPQMAAAMASAGTIGSVSFASEDLGAVPEPSLWASFVAGLGLVGARLRRRFAGIAAT